MIDIDSRAATRSKKIVHAVRVVAEFEEEALGVACLETARRLCLAAIHGGEPDVEAEFTSLRDLAHEVRLGPSTAAIVAAAKRQGIPARRLNDGSLIQLGHGARQRRIWTAETDLTVPAMTTEAPGAGRRVKMTLPAYRGTEVYHALYLPSDWQAGRRYPVIVEYAGNGSYSNRYGDVCDRVSFYAPYQHDPAIWADTIDAIRSA